LSLFGKEAEKEVKKYVYRRNLRVAYHQQNTTTIAGGLCADGFEKYQGGTPGPGPPVPGDP